MNRSLLIFSLLIIFAGLALGLYIITFFGLLLLIPALAAPSRPPARNAPPQPAQTQSGSRVTPRRSSPPPLSSTPSPMSEPVVPPSSSPHMASMATSYSVPLPSPAQPVSYAPALFPTVMLPSLSNTGSAPQPVKPLQEAKHEGPDELVEVGALLAILKLVFG